MLLRAIEFPHIAGDEMPFESQAGVWSIWRRPLAIAQQNIVAAEWRHTAVVTPNRSMTLNAGRRIRQAGHACRRNGGKSGKTAEQCKAEVARLGGSG